MGLWAPAVPVERAQCQTLYLLGDLALVRQFEQWLPLHVCIWVPARQRITSPLSVWQIVFSRMITAISSSTSASRTLPLTLMRRWGLFLLPLKLLQWLEYSGKDVIWLPTLVLRGNTVSTWLSLLRCLTLEHSCHAVSKPRPQEATWMCSDRWLLLWPQPTYPCQVMLALCLRCPN